MEKNLTIFFRRPANKTGFRLTLNENGLRLFACSLQSLLRFQKRMKMETRSERESKLADEIIESQKTRSDLLKWKFVICAALGGIGFGFANNSGVMSISLLALIPLACLYVDLICTNLNIRIINIGSYFSKIKNDQYERFIGNRRVSFSLEDWALYGANYIISVLLVLTGI